MTTTMIIAAAAALLLVTAAVIIIFRNRSRRRKKSAGSSSPYIEALHQLLDGRTEEAIEKLKLTVKQDTENIMAYVKLGDLYRQKQLPLRAAKIHRTLLVRGDLDEAGIRMVLSRLVQDYRSAGALDQALEMAERLIEKDKKNIEYQKLLLSVYEEKQDWDKAFFYRQSINKWQKKSDTPLLALYKVQAGMELIAGGAEREGRIRFREALKIDKKCVPAYLYWGDSYRRQDRDADALKVWKEFCEKVPDQGHLAFPRLQAVLYDLGDYGQMEKIYKKVINRKPDSPEATLGLAELYYKQGDVTTAIRICEQLLETFPDSLKTMRFLAELYYEKGDNTGALETALKAIGREMEETPVCTCTECGYQADEPFWRCPECGGWNSCSGAAVSR